MHNFIVWEKGFVLFVVVLITITGTNVISKSVTSDGVPFEYNNDAGYKRDAGDDFWRSLALFPGELVDDTPGRGRTGTLSSTDEYDCYFFSVCQGQQIVFTVTPPLGFDIDLSLWTYEEVMVTSSNASGSSPETITYTATYTGIWYVFLHYVSGSGEGQYTFSAVLNGQNDANSTTDASDTRTDALFITTGTYYGYLDMNDPYDWYTFQVNAGQGIHLTLKMKKSAYLTDFDLQLYAVVAQPQGQKCLALVTLDVGDFADSGHDFLPHIGARRRQLGFAVFGQDSDLAFFVPPDGDFLGVVADAVQRRQSQPLEGGLLLVLVFSDDGHFLERVGGGVAIAKLLDL